MRRRSAESNLPPHVRPAESSQLPAGREPLEAILLVGGQGTRLRPLTIGTPKPLLPTAGVPFLAHQLAKAAAAGVTRVVLATAYRAEHVRGLPRATAPRSAWRSATCTRRCRSAPAGRSVTPRPALRSGPDSPVVVLNGDVLSGHDIAAQIDLHRKADAAVTLHLVEVPDPARFGCVPTDAAGRVTAFLEKTPDPVTNRINAGCYVFRRQVIDEIPPGQVVSVERETFPGLISAGAVVMGYPDYSYWLDVGTPEAFVQGSCDLVRGTAGPRRAVPGVPGEAMLALDGAQVDPGPRCAAGRRSARAR